MVVKPILFCGTKCWPIKKSQIQRKNVTNMRMIPHKIGQDQKYSDQRQSMSEFPRE